MQRALASCAAGTSALCLLHRQRRAASGGGTTAPVRAEGAAPRPRHVYVVGAGVVGVTSAYALARRGIKVTVLDAGAGPAEACSMVNAGSICPAPWGGLISNPTSMWTLCSAVVRGDPVFQFHFADLLQDLRFWRFAVPFFCASMWAPWRTQNEQFVQSNLKYFVDSTLGIAKAEDVGESQCGRLIITVDGPPPSLDTPVQPDAGGGLGHRVSAEEAVAMEPSLAHLAGRISAAASYPEAQSMHCGDFVRQLATALQSKYGVEFRNGVTVQSLVAEQGRVTALRCSGGDDVVELPVGEADAVLVCGGASAPALLEPIHVRAPIFPMKGYSLTVELPEELSDLVPRQLIVHKKYHLYVTPFPGRRVRFTSIAEFGGGFGVSDASSLPAGSDRALQAVRAYAAECQPALAAHLHGPGVLELCGARPQCADDLPLVGQAPRHTNLFINAGHGQYGWALAAGCGEIVAHSILGLPNTRPHVECLDPARFDAFQMPWRRWIASTRGSPLAVA